MIVDSAEHVSKPNLRVDIVQLGGPDQGEHRGGALAAPIGAGEEPGGRWQFRAAPVPRRCWLGRSPIIEKPREGRPALHDVVTDLGGVGMARQASALGPRPALQCGNQRLEPFLSDDMPLIARGAVDPALNGEDLVDAANRFGRQWRLLQIRQRKELATAMGPARRFHDRTGTSLRLAQFAEP
jgi:hypothetical protein